MKAYATKISVFHGLITAALSVCVISLADSRVLAQGHTRDFDALPVPGSMALNAQFTNGTTDLNLIRDMGVGYVRHSFQWTSIEQSLGNYNWSSFDTYVSNMEARGMGIVFPLAYDNTLYEPAGVGRGITTAAGRQGYANWAAAAVDRYKGKDIIWEIWNEPNTGNFWSGSGTTANTQPIAKEYTDLVKAAVPAMRAADPNAKIVAGSASVLWQNSFNWMRYCFEEGILQTGIDGWSVHTYLPEPERAAGIDGFQYTYDGVRQLMTTYGGVATPLPLLNSESGWTASNSPQNGPAEIQQASRYVRQYMVDLMEDVRLTVWYDWEAENNNMHDIKENDTPGGRLRPAYFASQVLADELEGYSYAERIPLASSHDFALLFTNGQDRKLVAWTVDATHNVSLDITTANSVLDSRSMLGDVGNVHVDQGILGLSLAANPIYVTLGPDPGAMPTLVVNRDTGDVSIANFASSGLQLAGYSISSAAGVLDPAGWTSIDGNNQFDPDGQWTASQATAFTIAESVTSGNVNGGLLAGGAAMEIGAWQPWFNSPTEDLAFVYTLGDGTAGLGAIQYLGSGVVDGDTPHPITGEFDGIVDDQDVAFFVAHWGLSQIVDEQVIGNIVSRRDLADFNYDGRNDFRDWVILRANYSGSANLNLSNFVGPNVPEPSFVVLGAVAVLSSFAVARPGRRGC